MVGYSCVSLYFPDLGDGVVTPSPAGLRPPQAGGPNVFSTPCGPVVSVSFTGAHGLVIWAIESRSEKNSGQRNVLRQTQRPRTTLANVWLYVSLIIITTITVIIISSSIIIIIMCVGLHRDAETCVYLCYKAPTVGPFARWRNAPCRWSAATRRDPSECTKQPRAINTDTQLFSFCKYMMPTHIWYDIAMYHDTCMHACMHTYLLTYLLVWHTKRLAQTLRLIWGRGSRDGSIDALSLHTYIHAYIHACIHTYIHTCIHTYIHICMHACIHAYIHTYIHTYIHNWASFPVRSRRHTYESATAHLPVRAALGSSYSIFGAHTHHPGIPIQPTTNPRPLRFQHPPESVGRRELAAIETIDISGKLKARPHLPDLPWPRAPPPRPRNRRSPRRESLLHPGVGSSPFFREAPCTYCYIISYYILYYTILYDSTLHYIVLYHIIV